MTVTHPDCTRYFMTIPEAVGLVLVSGLNDYGELCILEMGEPVRIADLAHHLITMAGFVPNLEIPIVFTGLRPGEKLHEELMTEEEEKTQRAHNRILVAESPAPPADLKERLHELRKLADAGEPVALLRAMRELVPSYRTPEVDATAAAAMAIAARRGPGAAGEGPLRPGREAAAVLPGAAGAGVGHAAGVSRRNLTSPPAPGTARVPGRSRRARPSSPHRTPS